MKKIIVYVFLIYGLNIYATNNYNEFGTDYKYFNQEQKLKVEVYISILALANSDISYYTTWSDKSLSDYQKVELLLDSMNEIKEGHEFMNLQNLKDKKLYLRDKMSINSGKLFLDDDLKKFTEMYILGLECVLEKDVASCSFFVTDAIFRANSSYSINKNNKKINSIRLALASLRNSIRKNIDFDTSYFNIDKEIDNISNSEEYIKIDTDTLCNIWNIFDDDFDRSLAIAYIRKYQQLLSSVDVNIDYNIKHKPIRPRLEIEGGMNNVYLTPLLKASGFSDIDGDNHTETWWGIREYNSKEYIYDSGWHSYNKYTKRIPSGKLVKNKKYEAVVAFKDSSGDYSNGRFISFDTNEANNRPNRPIIYYDGDINNVSIAPIFNSSPFSDEDINDYHSKTWWGIKENNIYIWQTAWESSNNEIQIPLNELEREKDYTILVAYKDNRGEFSYGGSLDFTTSSMNIDINEENDFYIDDTSIDKILVDAGDSIVVTAKHNYFGNSNNTLDVSLGYYLSSDTILDKSDVYFKYDVSYFSESTLFNNEIQTLIIPHDTKIGDYYILFVSDHKHNYTEINENNNITYEKITINLSEIDEKEEIFPEPTISISKTEEISQTEQYLLSFPNGGITMTQAKNFIMTNLTNLDYIYKTCKIYGVTNDMLANILADEFKGITGTIVANYFAINGINSSDLGGSIPTISHQ